MKNFTAFLIVLFSSLSLFAQVITVKEYSTKQALQYVTVFNTQNNQNLSTDEKGQADISIFEDTDSIGFSRVGYKSINLSKIQLQEMNYVVFLHLSHLSLAEMLVYAQLDQKLKPEIPGRMCVIQQKEIMDYSPQTAADLLSISGEVFIQKSQQGGGSPMIRGFATNRVLLMVDGVRMNNAIFRSGNIQNVISIDPLSIQKIEVLFGPGSVLAGSDAIGGTMIFHTLVPKFSEDKKAKITGDVFSRYSSANNEKTGHFNLNIGLKKWAFLSNATFSDFDDLKMGSFGPDEYLRPEYASQINGKDTVLKNPNPRIQTSSGYSQKNLMQKIRFSPNKSWDVQYGFYYSETSDIPRYDRLIEYKNNQLRDAEWYYGPQVWMMNNLKIHYKSKTRFFNHMNVLLAQQQFKESRNNRSFNSNQFFERKEVVDAYSLNLNFVKNLALGKTLYYGAEGIANLIGSSASSTNIESNNQSLVNTRYPNNSDWSSMGIYVRYIQTIKQNSILKTGIRYNHVLINAPFDTSLFSLPFTAAQISTGAITGNVGIYHQINRNLEINASLSTGFRAPNIDDIGKVFDSEPGAVIVPNVDLKPEYAYNAEVGLKQNIKRFIKVDISGFYTILDNAMVRREFQLNGLDSVYYEGENSRVFAIQNAAIATVYGMQAGFEFKFLKRFNMISRFTYQNGAEELEDGSKAALRHAVPFFGLTRINYVKSKFTADLSFQYQSTVRFEQLPPSEQAKPHFYAKDDTGNPYAPKWLVVNFKMMCALSKVLYLNAGVDNIFDVRYRPFTSGLTAPGRNFVVSMKASF
jgi:hemoglobin/transferrin/lactoferrin receptor protein